MSNPNTAPLERRKHKRFGINGDVTVRRVISGPSIKGSLFDLSLGGCLIWIDTDVDFTPVDIIEVRLQCGPLAFRVLGAIRNTSEHGRILGIEFHRLSPSDTIDLTAFIANLQASAQRENRSSVSQPPALPTRPTTPPHIHSARSGATISKP
jgi:c-di-GMP-binding flagellar brake protein YcgR